MIDVSRLGFRVLTLRFPTLFRDCSSVQGFKAGLGDVGGVLRFGLCLDVEKKKRKGRGMEIRK